VTPGATPIITTAVGSGANGFSGDGGSPTAAALRFPYGLAFDSAGNLYFSDSLNNRIRKVTFGPTPVINTVVGNGVAGLSGDGGDPLAASLNFPTYLAFDAAGSLYISDTSNNRIRKVIFGASPMITTVVGNGSTSPVGDGGNPLSATLSSAYGIIFDPAGNLYIVDQGHALIRKVSFGASPSITSVAGSTTAGLLGDSGPATAARLSSPYGIAFDRNGNLYIGDQGDVRVRKVIGLIPPVSADTTPPVVTAQVSPPPNAAGWNNQNVTVSWTVTDPESGIATSTGCASSSITTETAGVTLTCSAVNGNGLTGSASVTVKLDKTPPSASAVVAPDPNPPGWRLAPVTITFTGTDSLSGPAACTGPIILTTAGANQSASGTCTDVAGNVSAPFVVSNLNVYTTTPSGRVAYWKADGNGIDDQGGNNGTLRNGVVFASGEIGQAFSFSGNNWVDVTEALNLSQFTVSAWLNPAALGGFIVDKGLPGQENYSLSLDGAGSAYIDVYVGNVNAGIHYSANSTSHCVVGQWCHVAGTYDGSNLRMYFNGVLESTAAAPTAFATIGLNVIIGARYNTIASFYHGMVDELTIHNGALNAGEIGQVMQLGAAAPVSAKAVAHWGAENNAADDIGQNNGVLVNGATFAPGHTGQAFSFDGVNDYIAVTQGMDLAQYTIAAWVKPNAFTDQFTILHKGTAGQLNYLLGVDVNGFAFLDFYVGDVNAGIHYFANSTSRCAVGTWCHVAGSYDGANIRVYFNGVLEGSVSAPPGFRTVGQQISIGARAYNNDLFMNGWIDELQVFNRALSQTEVQSVMNGGVTPPAQNQTIAFGPLADAVYGDGSFTVSATASSGLPVSFAAAGNCAVAGTLVTITGVGSCSVTASQPGNSAYSAATPVTRTFAIAQAGQTISVPAIGSKTYGDSPFTVAATATSGLPVTLAASGSCTVSGATVAITGAGSCTLTASQGGDSNFKAATPVAVTVPIAKAQATLTLGTLNYVYDGSPKTVPVTSTPVGLSGIGVTYSGSSTPPVNAGTYAVLAVLTNPNYQAANASGTMVIAMADQTITFAAIAPKTFGDPPFVVTPTANSGLPVTIAASGNCTLSGATVTVTGVGSCTLTASQSGDSNHNAAAPVMVTFPIAKAQATLTLGNLSFVYDGSPKTVSVTSNPAGLPGIAVTYSGSSTPPVNAGTYTVLAVLTDPNYQAANASGSMVIAMADQTITFAAIPAHTFGDPPFNPPVSASSGLPATLTAFGNCSASGVTVTITGAGSCTLTASQPGNANYNAAASVSQTFAIAMATQSITFAAIPAHTFGDPAFNVSPSASSGLPVAVTVVSGPASVSGTAVTILGAGTVTLRASQAGNGNYNAAPSVDRAFTVAQAAVAPVVSAIPAQAQYSDPAAFSVTLTPGVVNGLAAASSATFTVGGQTLGPVSLVANGTGLQAALPPAPQFLSPGSYAVSVQFQGVNPNFSVPAATASFLVTPEDARPTYTSPYVFAVAQATPGVAAVALSAAIRDISEVSGDPAYDANPGDIRTARVAFVDRGSGAVLCSSLVPVLLSPSDPGAGTVACTWNANIGSAPSASFTIGVIVSGGYARDSAADNAAISIVQYGNGADASGKGTFTVSGSAGSKAADVGSSVDVDATLHDAGNGGLNASFTASWQRTEAGVVHSYQLVLTSPASFATDTSITSSHPFPTAALTGAATLSDVTNSKAPVTLDANALFQVTMTDRSNKAGADSVGLTLRLSDGTLCLAAGWNGVATQEEPLQKGHINIK
jgi:sugar lactone lactonase YvrE